MQKWFWILNDVRGFRERVYDFVTAVQFIVLNVRVKKYNYLQDIIYGRPLKKKGIVLQ